MGISRVKESRILSNFDGSFDQVSTLAHELGHAFHNECAYQAGKTELQQFTPMTLAETASIMCETIVTEAVLAQVTDPQEVLAVLEAQINNASQVIVDIYSRYLFEKEVFERREKSELSADDLCEIMERAQKATYGEGLDERYLQKYHVDVEASLLHPAASLSIIIPTRLACSLQQACMPSTKNAAQTLSPITRTCSPPQVKPPPPNSPTASALTSAPRNSGLIVSPSSAGAWNDIANFKYSRSRSRKRLWSSTACCRNYGSKLS